jgi:hypothetical protein
MIETITSLFILTSPLWVFLGIMFVAILVVDGWQ